MGEEARNPPHRSPGCRKILKVISQWRGCCGEGNDKGMAEQYYANNNPRGGVLFSEIKLD